MRPLQEEIIKCKKLISNISINHVTQDEYEQLVYDTFDKVFVNYFDTTCPDKIEPSYLPQSAVDVLKQKHRKPKYGLGKSEN